LQAPLEALKHESRKLDRRGEIREVKLPEQGPAELLIDEQQGKRQIANRRMQK
jgi:hypothetical protein